MPRFNQANRALAKQTGFDDDDQHDDGTRFCRKLDCTNQFTGSRSEWSATWICRTCIAKEEASSSSAAGMDTRLAQHCAVQRAAAALEAAAQEQQPRQQAQRRVSQPRRGAAEDGVRHRAQPARSRAASSEAESCFAHGRQSWRWVEHDAHAASVTKEEMTSRASFFWRF
jgi:hypothetical protein